MYRRNRIIFFVVWALAAGALGFAIHAWVLDAANSSRPGSSNASKPTAETPPASKPSRPAWRVRLEPGRTVGESHDVRNVVLLKDGERLKAWLLGGIWDVNWSDVEVRHLAADYDEVFFLEWKAGSGTGISVYRGAVVCVHEGKPYFWSGWWRGGECHSAPAGYGYEYDYGTEVLKDAGARWRLAVNLWGESACETPTGEPPVRFDATVLCRPVFHEDGTLSFSAGYGRVRTLRRLMKIKCLSALRDDLAAFLPPDADKQVPED